MKKSYYYYGIAVILLLLLASLWGYFQYQKKLSYQAGIHQNADILIKADTYEIVKKFISHSKEMDSLSESIDSIHVKELIKSVEIPANIFLYTVKNKEKTTIFGSVKITDYSLFEKAIEKGFVQKEVDSKIKMLASKDRQWTIVYTQNTAAFSYSYSQENTTDILYDIIRKNNMTPVEESPFRDIMNKKGQIVFYDGVNEGNINLEEDRIRGSALIDPKKILVPEKTESPDFNKENIVSLWLQADIKPLIPNKTYTLDNYKINTDSLLASFQNEMQLEITEPVVQKDSIITYDFDDNFEKIEVVKIKQTLIPGLSLQVKSENGLYDYLRKQKIIINDEVNRKVFPLYQLYALKGKGYLSFSARKDPKFTPKEKSDKVFYTRVNFDKMRKQKEFSFLYPYITSFRTLEANARKADNKIQLDFDLEFTSGQNPVLSLLKRINQKKSGKAL